MNSIFVSSSFKDMQHERDMLRFKTLPQINEYLRTNYGQETTMIDLRWGINTDSNDERECMNKIIRTCLYEIDNCRPFMIVFIGDRYGTLIEKEQFEKHFSTLEPYNSDVMGVTELEIRYAMQLAKDGNMNLLFYFRDMNYENVSDEDKTNIYLDSEEVLIKRNKLDTLKKEITEKYPQSCKTYKATWDSDNKKLCGLDELSDCIFEDIKLLITKELGTPKKSPICIEDAFVSSKRMSFVGRQEEIVQINNFIQSQEHDIALLLGSVGVGKSSLMANIPNFLKSETIDYVSVFCGQSDSSDTALGVIRNIVYRIRLLLGNIESHDNETLWTANRWHQEMDTLIEKYINERKKTLVILIDAIDQMIQDIQTQKLYFLPYTHNGKIKVILSAVSDYKIESFLPSLEHMTSICMLEPSRSEVEQVIDEVWLKYGKPIVSEQIKKELREKTLSNNYLYVNILLTRLTYIGLEVFSDKNNNEQYLIDHISKIIASFPDTLEDASKELLSVLGKKINEELAKEVFSFLCLSENGLRITDIQTLCDTKYNASDFSCIKKLMGTFLFERGDHRIDFTHKIFRENNNKNMDVSFYVRYFEYARTLFETDPLLVPLFIHSAVCADRYSDMYTMLLKWLSDSTLSMLVGEKLASVIDNSESIIKNLVLNMPECEAFWKTMYFITNFLLAYTPASPKAKELIDRISDKIYEEYFIENLKLEELKLLSEFEEHRFKLHYKFSGGSHCETNRYLSCLKEIAMRELTFENEMIVADFRLDYDEYWEPFPEKYIFNTDRDERIHRITHTTNEILERFENNSKIDALLLCAKAYIKKADCEYADVIAFENEVAERYILKAKKLITRAVNKICLLTFAKKKDYQIRIAECYYLIGKIYMRVTRDSGWSEECFRHGLYVKAGKYLEKARELFDAIISVSYDENAIDTFLNVLYSECEIITQGDYLGQKDVEKIDETATILLKKLETHMYLITQSQNLCVQYSELCAAKANLISNDIPTLGHISERELYPWSTIFTREENYSLYKTMCEMDYWCDKLFFLCNYLFKSNPTPGNIERLINVSKSRINIFNYYEYRSLETIKNAEEKVTYGITELIVNKDAIEKDRMYQEKRKLPFLLALCEALSHENVTDKNKSIGLFLLVVFRLYSESYFSEHKNFLLQHKMEVSKIEKTFIEYLYLALENTDSFAYYVLNQHQFRLFRFKNLLFSSTENLLEIKEKCNNALDENPVYHNRLSRIYEDWRSL